MIITMDSRNLTAQDRCDSCSAAAKVVAELLNGERMFCGHHARKSYEALKLKAITLFDPEGELTTFN